MLQAALNLFKHLGTRSFVYKCSNVRFKGIAACCEFANSLLAPHQPALIGKINLSIGRIIKAVHFKMEMRRERLQGCRLDRFCLLPAGVFVLPEPKSFEPTDEFPFDGHLTLVIHFGQKGLLLLEPAQQNRCSPVHKSLRQSLMKSI